ncbi:MAG: hypothetical protein QG621_113 [Patescibacteria group bacterium]|nr:hypothetical protein [Patescibacteria group bacterium]
MTEAILPSEERFVLVRELDALVRDREEFSAWFHLLAQLEDPLVVAVLLQSPHITRDQAESVAVGFLKSSETHSSSWYALYAIAGSDKVSHDTLTKVYNRGGWVIYLALAMNTHVPADIRDKLKVLPVQKTDTWALLQSLGGDIPKVHSDRYAEIRNIASGA